MYWILSVMRKSRLGTVLFWPRRSYSSAEAGRMQQQDFEYPDDRLVDFDLRLIDLFP